ncbi:MAG TPA: hypothetical protein VFH68_10220 [Polyangia bacterium]|nr:hypothetical protein [Polyangia bacterium]
MSGLAQVLIGLLVLFAWAAPVVLAKLFADTLDRAPYLISLSAGIGVAVLLCATRWPVVRSALGSNGSARPGATAILLAIALCPTWAIGIGLGINRAFDRSPAVARQCRVLEWQRPAKGRARCLVTSWRGKPAEALSDALVQGGAPDAEFVCTPGQTLVVSTRAGRLGWEWIAGVRAR